MPPRRNAPPSPEEERLFKMSARVADLEIRVRLLEAKVRELTAHQRQADAAQPSPKAPTRAARTRARPRCPGCLLELPKGRRGETCVWCGFMFSAVGGRTFR